MRSFFALAFYLVMLMFVSARSLFEKMSSHPLTINQIQKQESKYIILPPGARQNEDVKKIIQLRHLIELDCLKKLYNQIRYKNHSAYRRPFGMIKPLQIPALRNDGSIQNDRVPHLYNVRPNQPKPESQIPRRYFGNDRILFVPPYLNTKENHLISSQKRNEIKGNKTSQAWQQTAQAGAEGWTSQEMKESATETQKARVTEHFTQETEDMKYFQATERKDQKTEGTPPIPMGNPEVFTEKHKISKANAPDDDNLLDLPQYFTKIESTITTFPESSSHYFWYQTKPDQVQPYEVEEIIEEKVTVKLDDDKENNFKNFHFDETTVFQDADPEKEIKTKLNLENKKKGGIHDVIGNSINTVLQSLINPVVKISPSTEKNGKTFLREKSPDRPPHNKFSTLISPRLFRTFSNHRPPENHRLPDFVKKFSKNKPGPPNHEEPPKLLKTTPTPDDAAYEWERKSTTGKTEKITTNRNDHDRVDITPTLRAEHKSNVQTTYEGAHTSEQFADVSQSQVDVLKTEHQPDVFEDPQDSSTQDPSAATEMALSPISFEPLDYLNASVILQDFISDQKINDLMSFPSLVAQEDFTVQQATTVINTEKPSTFFSDFSEIQTDPNEIFTVTHRELPTAELTSADRLEELTDEMSTEETSTTTSGKTTLKTIEYSPESSIWKVELTTSNFQEITDHPLSFDLLTTINSDRKKEQETVWKNSRKMHFGEDSQETKATNQVSELGNPEQRRSDILITENFDDYDDVDNNLSTLNYLFKLKQNNSFLSSEPLLNLTSDSIIPLIPVVINDLREGKISPKDFSVLEEAFGKYWTTVMTLTNSTNLDMLPLLKMKNEKDLKNVLQSFLPESFELTTTETVGTDTNKNDEYESYDYLEEYKDLYEDVLDQELGEKEKRRKKLRPKRDGKTHLKREESTREYFDSIQEELDNTPDNYVYEDLLYSEMSEGEVASVFELRLEVADLNIEMDNVTLRTINKVL